MVNLAEKQDGDSSAQLADAEISRILSALQKAEFKRSENGNARPDQTFKPRSLMEIAETTWQQDAARNAAAKEAADTVLENTEVDSDPTKLDDDLQGGEPVAPTDTPDQNKHLADTPTGQAARDVRHESAGSPDETSSGAPQQLQEGRSDVDESPATDIGLGGDAAHESGTDHDVGRVAPISPFETAQEAYDRGYGDGIVAGRESGETELRATVEAEFEAKLADKIDAFESALMGLKKPQASDTNSLSASLKAAVLRLAAARAGSVIDELPDLMVTRIENLADAAGKNVSAGHVFMHPDDCAVIAPIMTARKNLVKIEADHGLHRGDIRIRFDGIDISDIADLRADWEISNLKSHKNSAEAGTTQSKISDVASEIQTFDNLGDNSQDAPTESNMTPSSLAGDESGNPLVDSPENNENAPQSEAIGLMPLTTTGGDDPLPTDGSEKSESASSLETVGLMPLTTTGGDDTLPAGGSDSNENASSLETVGLMPLTTIVGNDSAPDEEAEEGEDSSSSETNGLMPLTSKNIEE